MRSVIVISTVQPNFQGLAEAYSAVGSTDLQSPDRLVVEGSWGWFAIERDPNLVCDFSDLELTEIARHVPEPVYCQLEYSTKSAADLAVQLMPKTVELFIDNDHGGFWPIEKVEDLIREGVEWQTTSL